MKKTNDNYSNFTAYITQVFGRKPSSKDLIIFENNQDLLKITIRSSLNNSLQITFYNCTTMQLLAGGIIMGDSLQIHSKVLGHLFYSVFFSEADSEEEDCLMLDAVIDNVIINGCCTDVVRSVRMITIEELIDLYSPITYIHLN